MWKTGPAFAALLLLAQPAFAQGFGGVDVGGVNLAAYCERNVGPNYASILVGPTAGDWRCKATKQKKLLPISVQTACRQQHGRQDLLARALDWNVPTSWRCFTPPKHR